MNQLFRCANDGCFVPVMNDGEVCAVCVGMAEHAEHIAERILTEFGDLPARSAVTRWVAAERKRKIIQILNEEIFN